MFERKNWLNPDITKDQTKELRDYLTNELEIKEISFKDLAEALTSEFLAHKSDEWLVEFYNRLLDQESLWREGSYASEAGVLRLKPIIRLENNEHIAPFDPSGKPQVYLPGETRSAYKTVKMSLTKDPDSLKFLESLGLVKPDLFSELLCFHI